MDIQYINEPPMSEDDTREMWMPPAPLNPYGRMVTMLSWDGETIRDDVRVGGIVWTVLVADGWSEVQS